MCGECIIKILYLFGEATQNIRKKCHICILIKKCKIYWKSRNDEIPRRIICHKFHITNSFNSTGSVLSSSVPLSFRLRFRRKANGERNFQFSWKQKCLLDAENLWSIEAFKITVYASYKILFISFGGTCWFHASHYIYFNWRFFGWANVFLKHLRF